MTTSRDLDLTQATDALAELAGRHTRAIVGITGPPAAGKSTVAAQLAGACRERGVQALVVPMDGFHLAQSVLDARGLAPVKGAPQTFDALGYVELIARIRRDLLRTVWAPTFDRSLEEPIAGAIGVTPETRVVLTEGNYLLLDEEPWRALPGLLDATWYVETPDPLRRDRLVARHRQFGRSAAEAAERTLGTDERNARLIAAGRARADAILHPA